MGVAVCRSHDVRPLRCGGVAVWGSCSVMELQCGGVAVWGELHYVGVAVVTKPEFTAF